MTTRKKRIGVDVSGLTLSSYLGGIQRVVIEINKGLAALLDPQVFEIEPFTTLLDISKPENPPSFLAMDPIYSKPLQPIDSFDILSSVASTPISQ